MYTHWFPAWPSPHSHGFLSRGFRALYTSVCVVRLEFQIHKINPLGDLVRNTQELIACSALWSYFGFTGVCQPGEQRGKYPPLQEPPAWQLLCVLLRAQRQGDGDDLPGEGAVPHCPGSSCGCAVLQLPFEMGYKDLEVSSEGGFEVVTGFLYNELAKRFAFITLLLAVIDILISISIAR